MILLSTELLLAWRKLIIATVLLAVAPIEYVHDHIDAELQRRGVEESA